MSDEEDMIDEELMLDPHEASGNESMHASASLINPTFRYHNQKNRYSIYKSHNTHFILFSRIF